MYNKIEHILTALYSRLNRNERVCELKLEMVSRSSQLRMSYKPVFNQFLCQRSTKEARKISTSIRQNINIFCYKVVIHLLPPVLWFTVWRLWGRGLDWERYKYCRCHAPLRSTIDTWCDRALEWFLLICRSSLTKKIICTQ